MIVQHAALARRLAEELGLSIGVQEAVGSAYEQWDGKGWPGELRAARSRSAASLAQIGEFVEVAHRIGGVARHRAGRTSAPDRNSTRPRCRPVPQRPDDPRRARRRGETWDAVIAAEPSLGVRFGGGVRRLVAGDRRFVDLKSPYTLGHAPGPSRKWPPQQGPHSGS